MADLSLVVFCMDGVYEVHCPRGWSGRVTGVVTTEWYPALLHGVEWHPSLMHGVVPFKTDLPEGSEPDLSCGCGCHGTYRC